MEKQYKRIDKRKGKRTFFSYGLKSVSMDDIAKRLAFQREPFMNSLKTRMNW